MEQLYLLPELKPKTLQDLIRRPTFTFNGVNITPGVYTEPITYQPIYTLGRSEPVEYIPGRRTFTFIGMATDNVDYPNSDSAPVSWFDNTFGRGNINTATISGYIEPTGDDNGTT